MTASVFLGNGYPVRVGVILALLIWTGLARIVRGVFLSLREKEFVEAAKAAGAGDARIIVRHLLPNAVGPIIVAMTLIIAAAILIEAALSFLGFGIQPPTPALGKLIADGQTQGLRGLVARHVPGARDRADRARRQLRRRRPPRLPRPDTAEAPCPEPVLSIRDMTVEFGTEDGVVKAVTGVNYDLFPGEILGVDRRVRRGQERVGDDDARPDPESRPGRVVSGEAIFKGRDLLTMSKSELRDVRGGDIAMIFQDPMTSLNPVLKVGYSDRRGRARPQLEGERRRRAEARDRAPGAGRRSERRAAL